LPLINTLNWNLQAKWFLLLKQTKKTPDLFDDMMSRKKMIESN